MHPPFLADEEVDDIDDPEGIGIDCGEIGEKLSSPNRVSWISGLDTLLGGDPEKNGGDEAAAACAQDCCSPP